MTATLLQPTHGPKRAFLVALQTLCVLAGTAAAGTTAAPTSAPVDAATLARHIDQAIDKRLDAEHIKPSPLADDAEFLRRVYLDITGVIPPANAAAAFLDSKDPNKRAKLIDELLASSAYGRHLADIWKSYLLPRTSDNRQLQAEPLMRWLEENFNNNTPWNQFVSELITASGTQDKNGAVTYFLANPTADKVTDSVSRLFLGVQLQCAQCHNHPFTKWKQTEYWGMAAFFTKVKTDRPRQAARQGDSPGVSENAKGRAAKLPETAKVVPAKFLLSEEPKLDKSAPYRPVLAKWLTSAENPFFARAMANRLWAHYFGRGIVDPVDDMHDGNPPSHPELLQELAGQFAAHDFDVKFLIRAICNSKTYQRTSKPTSKDDSGANLFAHMTIKVNSPEQLYDSLVAVVGAPGNQAARPRQGANQNPNRAAPNARTVFVNFFQNEDGSDPTQYQAGIPQALRLMNSPQLTGGGVVLEQALKTLHTPAQIIERLYLATLSRRPTAAESHHLLTFVHGHAADPRKAYRDVLWALLNSSEFAVNH
ncbi:MAG TPA: DUF1549 and DUF1553 domain-containing protein [Gemmataceae bacterium]|nr:DUF1549 and DUF1553 domain-containing protein [Gemmataceae bacterium]